MKKLRHTPGPWRSLPIMSMPGGLPWTPIVGKTLVAKVYSEKRNDYEQSEAYARLMAAAPRMLEVLQLIVSTEHERHGYHPTWTEEAQEAIDLATKPTI